MLNKLKPHIPDLKRRLRTTLEHASDHFEAAWIVNDDTSYLLRAREMKSALKQLDSLVNSDRFVSLSALNAVCWTLVVYRKQLEEDRYEMMLREVRELVREIDQVRDKEF